jgi:hypothetical protein
LLLAKLANFRGRGLGALEFLEPCADVRIGQRRPTPARRTGAICRTMPHGERGKRIAGGTKVRELTSIMGGFL